MKTVTSRDVSRSIRDKRELTCFAQSFGHIFIGIQFTIFLISYNVIKKSILSRYVAMVNNESGNEARQMERSCFISISRGLNVWAEILIIH